MFQAQGRAQRCKVNLAAYTINGSNYFKLRDLAAALKGLDSEFAVTWNAAQQRIDLTSRTAYTPVGGGQTALPAGNKAATLTNAAVYLDGNPLSSPPTPSAAIIIQAA